MPKPPLTKSRVILTEGSADERFLIGLIECCEIPDIEPAGNAGGSDWKGALQALSGRPAFNQIETIIVIADSAGGPEGIFRDIVRQIRRVKKVAYPIPQRLGEVTEDAPEGIPNVVVITLPWIDRTGSLETLLLDGLAARHGAITEAANDFITGAPTGRFDRGSEKGSKARAACVIAALCEDDPGCAVGWMFKTEERGFYWLLDGGLCVEIDQLIEFLRNV